VAELHVHLLCAVPNALILEYLPWFDALIEEPLSQHGGIFAPPDRPGHGVRFDLEKLSQYRRHAWSTRNAGE
jgi:L-alanine-DL-glutamate epimerase-like enolase superfamily enzyme